MNDKSKFVEGLKQMSEGKPILDTGVVIPIASHKKTSDSDRDALREEAAQYTQQLQKEVFFPESITLPLPPKTESAEKNQKKDKKSTYKPVEYSVLGKGYEVESSNVTKSEEIEELKRMKDRELLFVRSSTEGGVWNTVLVYDDGIEMEHRTFEEDELTGSVEIKVHRRSIGQRLLHNNPVIPVQVVMVHHTNTPSDPEKDPSSLRKIRWKGMPSNSGGEWEYATVSLDFNNDEVKAQNATPWLPTNNHKWSSMLPAFKLMILNNPKQLWRNPNEYGGNAQQKFEHLPQLPVTHTFAVKGWCSPNKLAAVDGDEDLLSWEHITPSHQMYSGPATPGNYLQKSGDEAVFRDALIKQIDKYPDVGMWFAIACGAFAHGLHNTKGQYFKGDTSTLINIYGDRNIGKSTIFKQIQSILTAPENPLQFINKASDRGMELMLENNNHSFFTIDELQSMTGFKKGLDLTSFFMSMLNGTGRTVTTNGGLSIRAQPKSDNLVFTTSNIHFLMLMEKDMKSGEGEFLNALGSRSIVLDGAIWSAYPIHTDEDKRAQVKADIMDFDAVLQTNHGHLYDRIISYYSVNRNEVYDRLKHIHSNLRTHYNLNFTSDLQRKGHFFAYSEVGIDAFCSQMNLPKEIEAKIRTRWLQLVAYLSTQGAEAHVNKKQHVLNELLSWVKSKQQHFGIRASGKKTDCYAWPNNKPSATAEEQKRFAKYLNDNIQGQYGVFEQDDVLDGEGLWTGELWITSTGQKQMEKDGVMFKEIAQEAHANGFLNPTLKKDGSLDRLTKQTASHSWVYKFKLGAYLKAMREQEAQEEEERRKLEEIEETVTHPTERTTPVERASLDEDWGKAFEEDDVSETGLTAENIREKLFFNPATLDQHNKN